MIYSMHSTKGWMMQRRHWTTLKCLIIFTSIFTATLVSMAQDVPRVRINGRVIDAASKKPIHFVNVFLSNTTIGAATNEQGNYAIVNIPLGSYELIVSAIGYEAKSLIINLNKTEDQTYNFQLRPITLKAPELEVTAAVPKEWRRNLDRFRVYFLGQTSNASKCKLLNPEVLDFEVDEETNTLTATASAPLQIENRALGYHIESHLNEFSFREDNDGKYICSSHFVPLEPRDDKEEKRWKKNRLTAYYGSKRHFFISLAKNNLKDDRFVIRMIPESILNDASQRQQYNEGNIYFNTMEAEDIIIPGQNEFEKRLSFPEYLEVIFTNEDEEKHYPWANLHRGKGQFSWLKMTTSTVTLNTLGILYNPYAVTIDGYMAWERIAEMLPKDFNADEPMMPPPILAQRPPDMIDQSGELTLTQAESISLIKTAQQLALDKNVEEATHTLYRGLRNLGSHAYADTLYQNLKMVMHPAWQKGYEKTDDKGIYLLGVWQRLDPTPATMANERIVEHWQRYDYVMTWYRSPGKLGYDDRGTIYMKYGEPEERLEMAAPRGLYANESWVYRRFGREVVFDFIRKHIAYELIDNLMEISPLTTKQLQYEQVYEFVEPRMNQSLQYAALGSKLLSKMENMSSSFSVQNETGESTGKDQSTPGMTQTANTDMDLISAMQSLQSEMQYEQISFPVSVTSHVKEIKPLQGGLASARFPQRNLTRLEIYYGIPINQLEMDPVDNNMEEADLNISYAVRDTTQYIRIQKNLSRQIQVPAGSDNTGRVYIDQINELLSPGDYLVSVEIENPQSGKSMETTYGIEIPRRDVDALTISDLQLAYDIQPTSQVKRNASYIKGDLSVMPFPSYLITKREAVNLYFEINNLLLAASGQTSYQVEYELRSAVTGMLAILIGEEMTLASSYKNQSINRNTQEYFSVDFSRVEADDYKLVVHVTDEVSGAKQTQEIRIKLVE